MQFRLYANLAQFLQWLPSYWGNYFKILTLVSRLYLFWLLSLWLSCIHSSHVNYGQSHFPVFSLKISSCFLSRGLTLYFSRCSPSLGAGRWGTVTSAGELPWWPNPIVYTCMWLSFPQKNYLIWSYNYEFSSWLIYGLSLLTVKVSCLSCFIFVFFFSYLVKI